MADHNVERKITSEEKFYFPRCPADNLDPFERLSAIRQLYQGNNDQFNEQLLVSSQQNSDSGFDVVQATNNFVSRAFELSKKKDEVRPFAEALYNLPHLGLKFDKRSTFLKSVNEKLFSQKLPHLVLGTPPRERKMVLKSGVSMLRIGSWEIVAQNLEDVVAKCYFGKRRLVWEILENCSKKRIQIPWEHIQSMRATIDKNQCGVLKIELNQRPSFHLETRPQPRKHTTWKEAKDFTDGQAIICRRHYLEFPQGALDKFYRKLLHVTEFLRISWNTFPSLQSPHFPPDIDNVDSDVCSDHNGYILQNNSLQQPPHSKDFQNVSVDCVSSGCTGNIGSEINSVQERPNSGDLYNVVTECPFGYYANGPPINNLQPPSNSSGPMTLSPLQACNQAYQSFCCQPPIHSNDIPRILDACDGISLEVLLENFEVGNASNMEAWWNQLMSDFADITQRDAMTGGQFSSALTETCQANSIAPRQDHTNLLLQHTEEELQNQPSQISMTEDWYLNYLNMLEGLNNETEEKPIIYHQNYCPPIGGHQNQLSQVPLNNESQFPNYCDMQVEGLNYKDGENLIMSHQYYGPPFTWNEGGSASQLSEVLMNNESRYFTNLSNSTEDLNAMAGPFTNTGNYGGECIGNGDTAGQGNTQPICWAMPQDILVNMCSDPNETMPDFRGIQKPH